MRIATFCAYNIARLYCKMWYIIPLYLTTYEFAHAEIDNDQNTYLLQRHMKCGINHDTGSTTKSRIVNGKPSEQIYPWMAYIHVRVAVDIIQYPNGKQFIDKRSGGVVITDKAIITCGHCLCNDKEPGDKHNRDNMTRTCLAASDANQNQQDINEIWTVVGELVISQDKIENFPTYDADTQAFLYCYEPYSSIKNGVKTTYFSKNGDVGIVIKNNGLSMKNAKYIPICLPTPETFKKEKELEVKLAGWGWRYESTNNLRKQFGRKATTYRVKSSCLTNGARLIDVAHAQSRRFISCKRKDKKRDVYCWDVFYTKNIRSFSTAKELNFGDETSPSSEKLQKLYASFSNGNNIKECEEYYDEAKKVWIEDMISRGRKRTNNRYILGDLFDKEVERFEIRTNDIYGKKIETCYNVKAVAFYGICETTEKAPFNWGFCSTSCDYGETDLLRLIGEPYHEAIFKYLDTAPKSTKYSGNISQNFYRI